MAKSTDCLSCGQKFKQKDPGVKCAICGLWSHVPCSGLSAEFFKCILEQFKATGRAYWACRSCNTYAEKMNHRLKEIEDKATEAVRLGEENEKEIRKMREDMAQKNDQLSKKQESSEANIMAEMNEREARRKNIVVYGMEESKNGEGRKRIEDDKRGLDTIFTMLDINVSCENYVEFCRRVRERGEHSRPLVVGFFTDWSRSTILKHSKRLDGTEMENVTVAPNLTHQQRKAESDLAHEAERKNVEELTEEDLSKNLIWKVIGKKGQK